jgi:L-ribulokinase
MSNAKRKDFVPIFERTEMSQYTIGLDYGTSSVRALVVRLEDGAEVGTGVFSYPHGEAGVMLDEADPHLARQNPLDYLNGAEATIQVAIAQAEKTDPNFSPDKVLGIGVDTTGSSPMPVDADGNSLSVHPQFAQNLAAYVWLWKDHTSTAEAAEITALAHRIRPHYIAKYGGVYSSEWYWAKLLHGLRVAPEIVQAAADWVEVQDWIPAQLTGQVGLISRGICAAGHKGLYHPDWGFPDNEFLEALDPALVRFGERLKTVRVADSGQAAGGLTPEWADKLGLKVGIPVAMGAFDAHLGAVGAGVGPGTLVKIMGTSTCDVMVSPLSQPLPDIPGLCGITPGAVFPGYYSLEAGQSAVGDLFAWWTDWIKAGDHASLSAAALELKPGESGLLALDWNNGNRTVLVDQNLSGLLIGQSLYTKPEEVYRALVEATAFGARAIIERIEEYGVKVEQVVACGGIAEKSPLVMQIYADVLDKPMLISRSAQTCALGSAVAAAVVAGAYPSFTAAQSKMTGLKPEAYHPQPKAVVTYNRLYALYKALHDAFGTSATLSLSHVMKELIAIRQSVV